MVGASTPLEAEWSLLREACADFPPEEKTARIRQLLARDVRWNALLALAEHHGVQPIFTQSLLSSAGEIPGDVLLSLQQSYQANLHKALFLSRELVRIIDALSRAGIEVIPYKGLVLAETVYGDTALRQSGDIDLLIHADDLKRVREAVRELGFTPHTNLSQDEEEAYLKSGYECAFDGTAGRNLLEVQWAIQPRFYAVDLDVEGLFRRAQMIRIAGLQVKSLSPEDLFVVLALHAAKHVWGRLIWLCDLARISALQTIDWKRIGDQARQLGIVRILRVTLDLAQRLLGCPISTLVAENLPEDLAAGRLAEEIATYISAEKIYGVESLAYFRLMLRLRERHSDQVRFVSRFLFTPGPGEWAVTRLPRPLFPLYRIVRIGRLSARMVSGGI